MPSYYEFKLPAKILSGDGALEHIPHELEALGSTRPLLLSDEGLVKAGAVATVEGAMAQGGGAFAAQFCRIPPDSSIQTVNEIAAFFRQLRDRHLSAQFFRQFFCLFHHIVGFLRQPVPGLFFGSVVRDIGFHGFHNHAGNVSESCLGVFRAVQHFHGHGQGHVSFPDQFV